jgi:integrase
MRTILDLTWDRVNFKTGMIDYLPAGRHQTNKRRVKVSMNKTSRRALQKAYDARTTDYVIEYGGGPIDSVKKAIARVAKKTGIKCSPHVFRHTAGVWMAEADVPMEKIADYLGTSVEVARKHYAHYSPSEKRKTAEHLELDVFN